MKKTFLVFLFISLLIAVSVYAQKKTEVLLKFSKQEGLVRIVLEAEETFISKTKVTPLSSQVKIEFPASFNLKAQRDLPFEIVPADKSLIINLKEKSDIKSFKLTSPARVVLDIQKKAVQSERQAAAMPSKAIVIDAGHGGYDFGITYGTASEKDISLNLAKDLGNTLIKKGRKVFFMRRADQYVSLAERINLINQKNPDVFISFHSSMLNSFVIYSPKLEEQSSNEVIDFYSFSSKQKKYIGKSKALSSSIKKAVKDEFKTDVINREMPLPILNSAGAPSVMIEYPSPRFLVYNQQTRTRLINSIMNGLSAYGQ